MQSWQIALRDLSRNRRRTALTAAAIALATLLFTVLVSVPASLDRAVKGASTGLRVIVIGLDGSVPDRYCHEIEKMPGVAACAGVGVFYGAYRDPRQGVPALAIDNNMSEVFPDYQFSPASLAALAHERSGALAGSLLMQQYRWRPGQQVTLADPTGTLRLSFIVIDKIPHNRYPAILIFRRDYLREAWQAAGLRGDPCQFLVVRVDNSSAVAQTIKRIDEAFHNSDHPTASLGESQMLTLAIKFMGNVRAVIISVCIAIVLTMLTVVGNSVAMMVRERRADIAVMRALGFGPRWVAILLLSEGAWTGLLGGVVGAGGALALFFPGHPLFGAGYLETTSLTALAGLAVAVAVGLLSAAIPVFNAIRIKPAMAFRPFD